MRKVAAVREVQSHKCVAGFEHSHKHSHIGLRARVRLHIGIFSAKKLLEAFDSQRFHFVDHLATAVIAVSGITFGIFIS